MLQRIMNKKIGCFLRNRAYMQKKFMCTVKNDVKVSDLPKEFKEIPREVRRQARQEIPSGNSKSNSKNYLKIAAILSASGALFWNFSVDDKSKEQVISGLRQGFLGQIYDYIALQIAVMAKPFTDPSREKLLPDWPIPGVPPNMPPIPTLILDLEDTLIHSEWDRRYGWRHAKRPGVDKFLETMAGYYEIVIFSKHLASSTESVIDSLDKNFCAYHRLYRDSTKFLNGIHVKDISSLNRDIKHAIIIDDDPEAYQLQPENAIPISPFVDVKDRSDTALLDLMPFLQALVLEHVDDFRVVLNQFRDEDGVIRDLPSKYQARLMRKDLEQVNQPKTGLGGFLRKRKALSDAQFSSGPPPSLA